MNELFWVANDNDREKGYQETTEHYVCLLCDYKTEKGYIYPKEDLYVDAEKKMVLHIEGAHVSVFDALIQLEKKVTGFSEHQSKIMRMFYNGLSDFEVQTELNIGSASTIRNHRHMLKEKEKQAKVTVTMMGILNKKMKHKPMIKPHTTATMVDKRYEVTIEESIETLNKYFPKGTDGPLKTFSMKEKYKLIVLREVAKRFENNKKYDAKEVDDILKAVYSEDHVQIRRYLIEYGFLDRTRDNRTYWVKEKNVEMKKKTKKEIQNERKKELVQTYQATIAEKATESGVYQIKNMSNHKIYIGSARNINQLNGLSFQLNTGTFRNKKLQSDWSTFGETQFEITVLELFEEEEGMQVTKELKRLEKKWKEQLQPYGDLGYHKV